MGHIHPLPAGLGAVNQRQLPIDVIVRGDAYRVAGGNWTQLTISLANFDQLSRSPAGLWVLSMANCDDKANAHPWDVVEEQLGAMPLT